jgi:hypothetical protein
MKRGNFIKTYRLLRNFYYIHLLKIQKKQIDKKNNFLFLFKRYLSFKDFDRVLLWKFKSLNCIFSHKYKKLKKKKRSLTKINFVTSNKRSLLTINFIKYIILLNCKRKKKKMQYNLFKPLYDYIINDKNNSMLKVKYRIYKLKLMQMQN